MKNFYSVIILLLSQFQFLTFSQGSAYCGPYKHSSPINRNQRHNEIIENFQITNPSGHCIKLIGCSDITIRNCKLGPSKNEGVYLYHCSNITVTNCSMDSVDSGIVADSCTGIKITYNNVKNVLGPLPRGQMVQFGHVYGSDNCISFNIGENIPGQSSPEDEISLYKSNGIEDYKLRNTEDLYKIYGIDFKDVKGYNNLADSNRLIFEKFIINFYNALGLESRSSLIPKGIFWIESIQYLVKENPEDDYFIIAGGVTYEIDRNGFKIEHSIWKDEDYKDLEITKSEIETYLRIEYLHQGRKEWLHITKQGKEWY